MSSLVVVERVILDFRWLALKVPTPTFRVMIVSDKLYAQMLELIFKGVPFEVVREDEEDAVLTRSEMRTDRSRTRADAPSRLERPLTTSLKRRMRRANGRYAPPLFFLSRQSDHNTPTIGGYE